MKIGIVTFLRAKNYGAVLQAFALKNKLESLGSSVMFIDYRYQFESKSTINISYFNIRRILGRIRRLWCDQYFERFVYKYLHPITIPFYDISEIERVNLDFDLLIVGSDQVWNPEFIKFDSDQKVSWLQFGKSSTRRMSYAASFGVEQLTNEIEIKWKQFAKSLNVVSVREKNGIDLSKKIGIDNSYIMPDPTLLIPIKEYLKIAFSGKTSSKKYVMGFSLADKRINAIGNLIAAHKHMSYISISQYKFIWPLRGSRSPGGWLAAIRDSIFVVTDSYHCCLFAIIFHIPFLFLLKTGSEVGRNSRILTVLDFVNLNNRIIYEFDESSIINKINCFIDWDDVQLRIENIKNIGVNFLKEIII